MLPLLLLCALDIKAGAAKGDITPPVGHAMWGYAARKSPATGVGDRLYARALVIDSDGQRLALVSLDLGRAPTRASTHRIEQWARRFGVETVFLAASHTHHGPMLEAETAYVRALERKLGTLIGEAVAKLRPARLTVGGRDVTLNRNRHTRGGATDPQMLVLRAEAADGSAIATAVNFAAHPTTRSIKDLNFSADWVGAMAAAVEAETAAPCVFLQGAAGDLSPNPPPGHEGTERFGRFVGHEALKLKRSEVAGPIAVRHEVLTFDARVALNSPVVRAGLMLAFSPELVSFFVTEYKDGVRPRLTVAALGPVGFVGVSGEVFAAHAVHLKRRARAEHLFFVGYCNDYHQYFPTIEAVADGGYGTEVYIAPAAVGAGERIMDRALIHLNAVRGKRAD